MNVPEDGGEIQQPVWLDAGDATVWAWSKFYAYLAEDIGYTFITVDEYPTVAWPYVANGECGILDDDQWHECRLDFTVPAAGFYIVRFEFYTPPLLDYENGIVDLHFDPSVVPCRNGPDGSNLPLSQSANHWFNALVHKDRCLVLQI